MNGFNPHIDDYLNLIRKDPKTLDYYLEGILSARNDYVLSEAITILESDQKDHKALASQILTKCYPYSGNSRRMAVTGSPGVGKSTFIDSMISNWSLKDDNIAILTIDPSSQFGKGSILGDKTRMQRLAGKKEIFIRPSPARHHLGGLNLHTFEAIILCEAAGKELIILETVGAGQNETEVFDLVDCSILLLSPGGGDQLQGMKKGILEIADICIVHKADSGLQELAGSTRSLYQSATHSSPSEKGDWQTPYLLYSSKTGEGWKSIAKTIDSFFETIEKSGQKEKKRLTSSSKWVSKIFIEEVSTQLIKKFKELPLANNLQEQVTKGKISPFDALSILQKSISIHIDNQ